MKVLFLERGLKVSSPVYDIIRRIEKRIEVHIFNINVGTGNEVNSEFTTNVRCPFFPKIEPIKGFLFKESAIREFKRKFEGDIDIIHGHFAYPEGYTAYKLKEKYGIPYVISGRGDDIRIYPKRNNYLKKCVSLSLANCDAFIGVSQDLCDIAVSLGADPDKCYMQPEGIKPEIFSFASNNLEAKYPKTVLFVGSLLPVKNIMRMVEAFYLAYKKDKSLKFVIVGKGPLECSMKQKIIEYNFISRFKFLKDIDEIYLAELMRKSSILCLPSVSEGWPHVIQEAMACGTPVVAASVGGIKEQIISDDYGYLCDPYSPDDITNKILKALRRSDWNCLKIAERGRLFTREDMAIKTVKVYKKVLG